jgi:hypothetical protein
MRRLKRVEVTKKFVGSIASKKQTSRILKDPRNTQGA